MTSLSSLVSKLACFATILYQYSELIWHLVNNSSHGSSQPSASPLFYKSSFRPPLGLSLNTAQQSCQCLLSAPSFVLHESYSKPYSVFLNYFSHHFPFSLNDFASSISLGPCRHQMSYANWIVKINLMKGSFRKVGAEFQETNMTEHRLWS